MPHPRLLASCAELIVWAPGMISMVEVCPSIAFPQRAAVGHLALLSGVCLTLPGCLADQVGLIRLSPIARAPSFRLELCTQVKASGLIYSNPLLVAPVFLGRLFEGSAILTGIPRGQVGLAWFSQLSFVTHTLARVEALAYTRAQRMPGPQRRLGMIQESASAGSHVGLLPRPTYPALGRSLDMHRRLAHARILIRPFP